ncbi:DNA primase [Sphaerisporangium album]|uniref:DNA primase n=1 Tax=Sphaerisporangium album TaxID=509200 RepID=A0A367ELU5_9ACTN|nr:bifunctional DNA primase/polymerase [Sphaerisporangium album]RCG19034.1 DNA primase [Sphaerisporangium album]
MAGPPGTRRDDVSPPHVEVDRPATHAPGSLAIARWCAAQGWPVHPLAPRGKTPAGNCRACRNDRDHVPAGCPCLAAGRWCHGFHAATTDPQLIARWWSARPDFGVGIACGPARLVVIDIDAHPGPVPARDRILPGIPVDDRVDLNGLASGFHTLALLSALRGAPDPAGDETTMRVRTPSGGLHVWYRTGAPTYLCSTGSSSGRALAWQVDVRAAGGYIIAPGTQTNAGTYSVLGSCRHPAPLPDWLAQELTRTGHLATAAPEQAAAHNLVPPRARQAVLSVGGGRTAVARALDTVLAEVLACASVPEGAGFTGKLNRAAYTAGGLIASGHLQEDQAEQLLTQAAAHARPGQDRRCAQIIRNGLIAGARRPLTPQGRT